MKRILALLLTLVVLCAAPAAYAADDYSNYRNTGTRHQPATARSRQAWDYYTGDYTYEKLAALEGTDTDNSLEAAASELFAALHTLMWDTLTHTVTYKSLTKYWKYTDASGDSADAVLFYADEVGSGYSREHVWPKSQGNFYQSGAGSDLHHLRPSDAKINSARGNYTMGDVCGTLSAWRTYEYAGKPVLWLNGDYRENGDFGLVEVADEVKGDVARILLYVYVAYGDAETKANLNLFTNAPITGSGNDQNLGYKVIDSLDTLLRWCMLDPVDTWEMSRNDCVERIQGNRNVFIDYPELAWLLFDREIPAMTTPSGQANSGGKQTGQQSFRDVPAGAWYAEPVRWAVERGITTGTTDVTFSPESLCSRGQILTFLWRAAGKPEAKTRQPFSDVPKGVYYEDAARWAYEQGMVAGPVFDAASLCSRLEAVTYLWQAAGSPEPAPGTRLPFIDVDPADAAPVLWALEQGVTTGTAADTFSPNRICSRAQIAAFLYRAFAV